MQIRAKLTIKFALIVASILLLGSFSIYYFSSSYRQHEFYLRLKDNAKNTAKLLIDVDEVSREVLEIIDKSTTSLPKERVSIYNKENQEIYNSNPADKSKLTTNLLNKIRRQKEYEFTIGIKEAIGVIYLDRNKDPFVLIASAHDVYGLRKLNNLKWVLAIVLIVSSAITIVAGWIFAGQSLKPISNVVNQVEQISEKNLYARVTEGNRRDEIATLAITFNKMLDRLETAFKMQRSFVDNASHELRTPLTSVKSQIEVALINKRDPMQYEKVLGSLLEDVNQMRDLSNGLLDLAQMSMTDVKVNLEEVRIDELLLQAAEELREANPNYGIEIDYSLDDENDDLYFTLMGNALLLKSAFLNIMDNACKFSENHKVSVRISEDARLIKLIFADQGIGISQDDLTFVKEPFFRASNASGLKGHGLGLTLTTKIIALHDGDFQIVSTVGKGTIVTTILPIHPKLNR